MHDFSHATLEQLAEILFFFRRCSAPTQTLLNESGFRAICARRFLAGAPEERSDHFFSTLFGGRSFSSDIKTQQKLGSVDPGFSPGREAPLKKWL